MEDKMILLVEDNEDDIQLTLRALRKNNLCNRVEIARDGVEALEFLFCEGRHADRDVDDQPALVLLDINMPRMGGLDVLQQIRMDYRTRTIPVVILTSSREQRDLVRGYQDGANSYIQKPVDFEQFTESVRNLGLYWLVLNVPPPPRS